MCLHHHRGEDGNGNHSTVAGGGSLATREGVASGTVVLCDGALSAALSACSCGRVGIPSELPALYTRMLLMPFPLGRRKQRAGKVQWMLQIFLRLPLPLENNQLVLMRTARTVHVSAVAVWRLCTIITFHRKWHSDYRVKVQRPSFTNVYSSCFKQQSSVRSLRASARQSAWQIV